MQPEAKKIHALTTGHDLAVHQHSEKEALLQLCQLLGIKPAQLQHLKHLCSSCDEHGSDVITRCLTKVNACETTCETVKRLCFTQDRVVRDLFCPGNSLYSQITLDEYSSKTQVKLKTIVQNFGPGYVNAFPVPPGSAIRLEHVGRPGFVIEKAALDFALENNGTNYLDLEIQFYIGPGGTTKGKELGPAYDGNQFLNKDGTQIHIEFPAYRGKPILVGSFEKMAVEIRHTGQVNNLISATPILHHDAKCWTKWCSSEGC